MLTGFGFRKWKVSCWERQVQLGGIFSVLFGTCRIFGHFQAQQILFDLSGGVEKLEIFGGSIDTSEKPQLFHWDELGIQDNPRSSHLLNFFFNNPRFQSNQKIKFQQLGITQLAKIPKNSEDGYIKLTPLQNWVKIPNPEWPTVHCLLKPHQNISNYKTTELLLKIPKKDEVNSEKPS